MSIFALNEPTSSRLAEALHKGVPNSKIYGSNFVLSSYNFFTSLNIIDLKVLWENRIPSQYFFYVDKAYFARDRFFRINLNSQQGNFEFPADFQRLRFAGIRVRKRRYGSRILICPQSSWHFESIGLSREFWISQVINDLRKYTDRPIAIHEKAKGSSKIGYSEKIFEKILRQDVYATVVHNSMAGIQSALSGVPCLVTDTNSVVSKFGSSDFSTIENLQLGEDREILAAKLANNQWTLHEIGNGSAWNSIQKYLFGFFDNA